MKRKAREMKASGYSQKLENMTLALGLIGLPIMTAAPALAETDNQEASAPLEKSSSSFWDQRYLFGD